MRIKISGLIAAFIGLTFGIGAAWAEPAVVLTSHDGAARVEGEMIGFDGRTYTLRTSVGTITIDVDQVSCEGEGCPIQALDSNQLNLAGSNIIGDGLMPSLIEGYGDALGAEMVREVGAGDNERVFRLVNNAGNDVASVHVAVQDTTAAFSALANGTAAIGLASRRVNEAEAGLTGLRDSPNEHILALDGLIVIVHPDNPVRALALDQIAAIFAGQTTNWAELGGPDQPISVYVPDDRTGTYNLFETIAMAPRGLSITESAERLKDHADLSDLVSIDPAGIGVTGFAYARGTRMVAIRQECGLVSLPTSFDIKTEEYPLSRRLYAYDSGADDQSVHARGLLDFALSDAAQPIIAEAGFIDRDIESQGIEIQGARLAHSLTSPEEFSLPVFREMLTEIKDAERLSPTFRFTLGSSNLETRSQSEAERFARLLAGGAYRGKDILLVGFTDSIGEFDVNRHLAARRAQSVLDTLKTAVAEGALDAVPIVIQSYGDLTPVGCNETAEGRELNRRVEVWIRDHRG